LLATLLLLGFSIYLAAELNFIHLPWLNGSNATPTIAVQQIAVPDLRGKTYQAALSAATKTGFTLKVTNGITTGVVINQDPAPPLLAPKGSSIRVTFGSATQTAIVPPNLVGNTLSGAEQILTNAGLRYSTRPDGTDPNNNTPNITPAPRPTPTNTPVPRPTPTNTPVPKPTPTNTPPIPTITVDPGP
ncbi:MAG: PASTA domain-containing protein, partial [Chloroflexota bacterium]